MLHLVRFKRGGGTVCHEGMTCCVHASPQSQYVIRWRKRYTRRDLYARCKCEERGNGRTK